MDITIIGTGRMTEGISTRLASGRNNVTIMGRDKKEADEIAGRLNSTAGNESKIESVKLGDKIKDDIVILAIPYSAAASVVRDYSNQLGGKILIDITNPLASDRSGLATKPDTSAAEEIAKLLPKDTKVVKAFNTVFAGTLKQGQVAGQQLDIFVAGDNSEAKQKVIQLIESGNMRGIDAGPLMFARYLEGMAFLLISLQDKMKTNYMSAYKIIA